MAVVLWHGVINWLLIVLYAVCILLHTPLFYTNTLHSLYPTPAYERRTLYMLVILIKFTQLQLNAFTFWGNNGEFWMLFRLSCLYISFYGMNAFITLAVYPFSPSLNRTHLTTCGLSDPTHHIIMAQHIRQKEKQRHILD